MCPIRTGLNGVSCLRAPVASRALGVAQPTCAEKEDRGGVGVGGGAGAEDRWKVSVVPKVVSQMGRMQYWVYEIRVFTALYVVNRN